MFDASNTEHKKKDQNLILQLLMLNRSNSKICETIQNIDKKVNSMMKSDSRTRALALRTPTIPVPFINLSPTKSVNEVNIVESLLSNIEDGDKNKEALVRYILCFTLQY